MNKFFRAMGNSFLTIMMILLIVYGWAFIEIKLLLKSQPELFGYVFYMQNETDMSPEFESDDVIIVKKDADYSQGDIVLYFDGKDSKYKIHYVHDITGDEVTTKCAQCDVFNDPISTNNVVGKAIGKVKFMGAIINFFKQKVVLIVIAAAGLLFLIISQILEYKPSKKTEEQVK